MSRGLDTDRRESLRDEAEFLNEMQMEAAATAGHMAASWDRHPAQRDKLVERLALAHTVKLHAYCEEAFADRMEDQASAFSPLRLVERGIDPPTRYELLAAIHMVSDVLLFTDLEALRRLDHLNAGQSREVWTEAAATLEPGIVRNWHTWLWTSKVSCDPTTMPMGSEDHGDSSLLAIASGRIASVLASVRAA